MEVTLSIHPTERTKEGFAPVELQNGDGSRFVQLDIEYSKLSHFQVRVPAAVDLLLLATAVYAMDKLVERHKAEDSWTREYVLTVPVSDAALWTGVTEELTHCLSFLTGDKWTLVFTARVNDPVRPVPRPKGRSRKRKPLIIPRGDAVSLFSGGLDSLIGVIDFLTVQSATPLLVVGHHEREMAGPKSQQEELFGELHKVHDKRLQGVFPRMGHMDSGDMPTEITLRGRSFMFVALGIFVASSLGPSVPLLIPENGTIALNVPLTPSRRGSCSTRTAHPQYLSELQRVLAKVGLTNPIINPLFTKTKGEAIAECADMKLLNYLARQSVSCAKTGHKAHWTNRSASSCGRCMPCIYRRASMHKVGWDDELYGDDICAGQVDLSSSGEKPNDLRACFNFLRKKMDRDAVAGILLASGSVAAKDVFPAADMVLRTMDEIRTLIRDKGIASIKLAAGI